MVGRVGDQIYVEFVRLVGGVAVGDNIFGKLGLVGLLVGVGKGCGIVGLPEIKPRGMRCEFTVEE
ncbi:hypothetical protein Pyn_05660 [Prunus yedoensis var. nudiflora]|uniref:Uncharacterized protein n=1 Tax=Prunus yedoensis var. nudiflora TaxID=2094558 RepID=A0A314XJX4_PRUYE|nr:hypothetical protein Pyn_05660 [Prunus yedoensis var. nudiflora]